MKGGKLAMGHAPLSENALLKSIDFDKLNRRG
jgi:hypothetical protein